jgi:methionyl-tRNA formyltransferase
MVAAGIPLSERRGAVRRVLVVGDNVGVPRVLRHLDPTLVCGIMGAEIRPQYHSTLSRLAGELGLPFVVQPRSAASGYGSFVESIAGLAPDLILCDSYSMLLRPEVLRLAPAGAVNVHGGLLPRYRGANPIQWMLINDETDAGVTIHFMDEDFDSGSVIAQRRVAVKFTDTWLDVLARVNDATEDLLGEQLPHILSGTASSVPQDPGQARRFPHRKPDDGLIDWSMSIRDIYNLVRALVSPLPGAFYVDGGVKVILDRFMPIAEVALLKQRMIGSRPHLRPTSTDDRFVFDEGVLDDIDYSGRTAVTDAPPIEEFARVELGITSLKAPKA